MKTILLALAIVFSLPAFAGGRESCEAEGRYFVSGQCLECPAGKLPTKNGCECLKGFIDLGKGRSCACPRGTSVTWKTGVAQCVDDAGKPAKLVAERKLVKVVKPKTDEAPYVAPECDPTKACCPEPGKRCPDDEENSSQSPAQ